VDGEAIRQKMLESYGLRVEPHMSDYVARRLQQAGDALASFHVIGGDARTGMPMRTMVDVAKLQQAES
jgi:hypothetical protein